ncbi:hypothetical protein [Phenylobacterium sp.]|uniref:terminase small subunit-like protein n=1 Tax=Phenylobacterium sp. TaxID=1871053 RepID=UPI002B7C8503|nr:hypothetical protein [Phenylobacterium sp.]HVI32049.1 hypothetical protein [Phenylobacterium sp.]
MNPRTRPTYSRAQAQARLLARVEAGWTAEVLAAEPGMPGRSTVKRWAQADPDGFGARLKEAQAQGRAVRRAARRVAWPFHEARAEALLAAVRRGGRLADLLRDPGGPDRASLRAWTIERPDFAARLAEAKAFARAHGPAPWPYDEATADRVVLRAMRGARLAEIAADPALPGLRALRGWRRRHPEFDGALRAALKAGARLRGARRSACTPELTERVAALVLAGHSLAAVARLPGMPHPVTLNVWFARRPAFRHAVETARRVRDEALMEEALATALACGPLGVPAARARVAALNRRLGQLSSGYRRDDRRAGGGGGP